MDNGTLRARAALAAYLAGVVALTLLHHPGALALAVLVVLPLGGRAAPRLARRTLAAMAVFNGLVSLAYAAVELWQGQAPWTYLLRINLRVFALVYLGFVVLERVDLLRAVSFSRTLSFLFTLAYAQARSFRRLAEDFRLALRSRAVGPLSLRDRYRFAARLGGHLLDKAVERSTEIAHAMRSRGFFHD
jgi:cobalt/nickel transport system permease protein